MQLPEARAFGHKQALFVPALLAVGVLALAMRAWEMADKSIWLDEAWSWRAARLPLSSMVDWTAQDKHPPLYYGVLHYWTDAFGDGEAALRMPRSRARSRRRSSLLPGGAPAAQNSASSRACSSPCIPPPSSSPRKHGCTRSRACCRSRRASPSPR